MRLDEETTAHLHELELVHMKPEVRRDPIQHLADVLAEDFFEIGSSGRKQNPDEKYSTQHDLEVYRWQMAYVFSPGYGGEVSWINGFGVHDGPVHPLISIGPSGGKV